MVPGPGSSRGGVQPRGGAAPRCLWCEWLRLWVRVLVSTHLPAFSVLVASGSMAARVLCILGPLGPPTAAELPWGSPCLGTRFLTLRLASCAVRWWGGHHLVPGVETGSVPDPCGPGFKSCLALGHATSPLGPVSSSVKGVYDTGQRGRGDPKLSARCPDVIVLGARRPHSGRLGQRLLPVNTQP